MDIDAVIAEATSNVATQASTEATVESPKADTELENSDLVTKPDSELTAEQLEKREANRKSHANSREAKLRRELRELKEYRSQQESVKQAQAPKQSQQNDDRPKEADFENFIDFLRADSRYEAKQEFEQRFADLNKSSQAQTLDIKKAERISDIAKQEQEFAQRTPEYKTLYEDHGAFMDNMPRNVAEALLEAEDATLALYALMKEGKLQDLEDLSPSKIAMEIGKAEERGKGYLNSANRSTNTSAPISTLKGTGAAVKSLESKSIPELMKQFAT